MSKAKKIILAFAGAVVLFVVGLVLLFGYLFSDILIEEYSSIETKQLPQKNLTVFVFDGNLEQVRAKIISAIKFRDLSQFPFKTADHGYNAYFYICEAKDEICLGSNDEQVKDIFSKPANKDDVYLASDGNPIKSPVYYAVGKSLEFRTDLHVHLEAKEAGKTAVTIFAVKPTVYKGYGGIGLHGAILKKAIAVEPTTIEEYQLLRYIGLAVGKTDMPEVVLPQ